MAQHQFSLRGAFAAIAVLCALIDLFVWNAAAALLIFGAIVVSTAIIAFARTAVREQGRRMGIGYLLLVYAGIMVLPVMVAGPGLRSETGRQVHAYLAIRVAVTFLLGLILRINRLY